MPAETGRHFGSQAGFHLDSRLSVRTRFIDDPAWSRLGLRSGQARPQHVGGDLEQQLWLIVAAACAQQQPQFTILGPQ